MGFPLLSMTTPVPDGFVLEPNFNVSKLRRGVFCLYSDDPGQTASLVASLANRVSGLFVCPGTRWEWHPLGGFCYQWSLPENMVPVLSSLALPYLQLIDQAHRYDDKATSQAWDLQRAERDRLFLSRVQLEFRDSMLAAERSLREAQRYLNQIIEFLPDATMVLDRHRKVVAWNRAMALITGVAPENIIGKGDFEYAIPFYGERRPILVDLLFISDTELARGYDSIRREGSCLYGEVFVPKVHGGKGAHLMGSASLLHDQDGNIIGAVETIRDITEHHNAMGQLQKAKLVAEEANRAKSQFLSNVSHEIRTPLNGIIGFAELIGRERSLENVHSMAQTVLHESDMLLSLVNAVLDQARIESGKLDSTCGVTDLKEILATVTQTVELQARKKEISIRVENSVDVPRYVLADRLKVCQVLMNLMNNAVKFTERGGVHLRVTLERRELDRVWVRFEVIDTGTGIPDEKTYLVFQRFAQVDAAATRRHGGAGLGLSIARGLVEHMGGTLGFESEMGKGSTFWFVLPFSVHERQEETEAPPAMCVEWKTTRSNCPRCPILLVEDYPPNQDVARMHLEGAGYRVDIAGDGVAALRLCDQCEYSLILMDIQMPQMDGLEATRQLRRRSGWTEHVVILGLSANADEKSRKECVDSGMNGLVSKPIRREAFLREIASRLSRDPSDFGCMLGALEQGTTTLPMDYAAAVQEFAGDKSLLDGVIVCFVTMARKQLSEMKGYISAGDAVAIARESHKIKGAAANLRATRLSAVAKAMEEKGKSGDLQGLGELFSQLEKELDSLDDFVKNGYCTRNA